MVEVDQKYLDPRKDIIACTSNFCNDDWYVIVDYYSIRYDCLEDDPRARKEMEAVLEVVQSYGRNHDEIRKLALHYKEKKPNNGIFL